MTYHCAAHSKGIAAQLPVRKKAAPRKIQQKTVLILRVGDRVALRRRPSSGLLASLYEPPCLEGEVGLQALTALLEGFGLTPIRVAPLETSKHIFTHIEWHMHGKFYMMPSGVLPEDYRAVTLQEAEREYALPSAFRTYAALLPTLLQKEDI
jgi:A/G-specific adenine glycosylase